MGPRATFGRSKSAPHSGRARRTGSIDAGDPARRATRTLRPAGQRRNRQRHAPFGGTCRRPMATSKIGGGPSATKSVRTHRSRPPASKTRAADSSPGRCPRQRQRGALQRIQRVHGHVAGTCSPTGMKSSDKPSQPAHSGDANETHRLFATAWRLRGRPPQDLAALNPRALPPRPATPPIGSIRRLRCGASPRPIPHRPTAARTRVPPTSASSRNPANPPAPWA